MRMRGNVQSTCLQRSLILTPISEVSSVVKAYTYVMGFSHQRQNMPNVVRISRRTNRPASTHPHPPPPPPSLNLVWSIIAVLHLFDQGGAALLVLAAALVHVPHGILHDGRPVGLEVAHRDAVREELVDLLERAALGLGQEEVEEDEAAEVRAGPDVAVLGALRCVEKGVSKFTSCLFWPAA